MKFAISAVVVGEINNGFRLKVEVKDLGLYMYGWTVRESTKEGEIWWVQPPAQRIGRKYISTPEFDKSKQLYIQIQNKCIEAVESESSIQTPSDPRRAATGDIVIVGTDIGDKDILEGLDKAFSGDPYER